MLSLGSGCCPAILGRMGCFPSGKFLFLASTPMEENKGQFLFFCPAVLGVVTCQFFPQNVCPLVFGGFIFWGVASLAMGSRLPPMFSPWNV